MHILFDLFPIILFFIVFKFYGIYFATAVAIVATCLQILWAYYRHRKVEWMQWASLGIILIFGGSTLLFHNDMFIKWKPTVLYWVLGLTLVIGRVFFAKNFIQMVFKDKMELPVKVWSGLNTMWASFFIAMGFVNLFVAYSFSTDIWVDFKLFGTMGLMLVFALLQGLWLSKYIEQE